MSPVPRVPSVARRPARRDHLIVCGQDALTYRVVVELTSTYGQEVTVLLRAREQGYGPRIAALSGVRVVERAELDEEAFDTVGVAGARSLALLRQDDVGNFHAALRAQELNPDLRLVIAIFSRSLGTRVQSILRDCAVLSDSTMAAPAFVASALGQPAPGHVRVAGQTLFITRRSSAADRRIICGLVMPEEPYSPRLLPPDAAGADLVLAVADGEPRQPVPASARRPWRALSGSASSLLRSRFGWFFAGLLAIFLTGFGLLATYYTKSSIWSVVYLALVDSAGTAVTSVNLPGQVQIAQILLTFDGMALLPLATAAIVSVRLTGSIRQRQRPPSDHVIVVGLGNVGTRVLGQLHDLGHTVVCVDTNENALGVPLARRLGLRLVLGEAQRQEVLREAGIETCLALVSVTSNDSVNLETALHARVLAPEPRIVLRLTDNDLAQRFQRVVGNTISRSVPYVAAPAFAAAMLEHQVLRTIPVGRHVLLIADIRIEPESELAGVTVEDVNQMGTVRVLAVQQGAGRAEWTPGGTLSLAAQDRIYVLATRAGLSRVLALSQPPWADNGQAPRRD